MATKKLASLLVKVGVNGVEVEKEFRTLEKKAENLGKNLQSFGKKYSVAVTAPLIAAGYGAAKAADVQLKAEARLLTALKGREDIQQRLIAQAGDIQSRSTFGDEEIIAQQAYLASLGLTESQIKRVIDASVELSVATGSSLDSAVRNLAKTYGGLTGELGESIPALKNLTKEQLMNGEAVQYILDNYKGYAETTLEGLGSTEQLKNMIGDLGEQLGAVLLPAIKEVTGWLKDLIKWVQGFSPTAQKWMVGIGAVGAALPPLALAGSKVVSVFKDIVVLIPKLGTALSWLAANPIAMAVTAVAGLALAWSNARREQSAYEKQLKQYVRSEYASEYDRGLQAYRDIYKNSSKKSLEFAIARYRGEYEDAVRNNPNAATNNLQFSEVEYARAKLNAVIQLYNELIQREKESANAVKGEAEAVKELTVEQRKQIEEAKRAREEEEKLAELRERYGKPITNAFTGGDYASGMMNTTPDIKASGTITWMTDLTNRWKEWETEASGIRELASSVASTLESAAEEVAVSIGEGLGNLITGETFNPVSKILEIFGKTLKSLGSALVSFGVTMKAFKESLKSIFANPWAAIATGIAAIAAGTAFMNMAKQPIKLAKGGLAYGPTLAVVGDNPNAANDPEVIAPLSKLKSMGGASRLELTGEVEWVLSGSSLRAVLNKENFRVARLG